MCEYNVNHMQEAVLGSNIPIVRGEAEWIIELKYLYFYDQCDTTFEAFFYFFTLILFVLKLMDLCFQ